MRARFNMRRRRRILSLAAAAVLLHGSCAGPLLRASVACDSCDAWNGAQEPFKIFGNTYYVGVAGLSSVLVTSSDGHVLLDGGLPQSAPRIDANIRRLGFRTEDVRLIVNSHAHYDHAGGIAGLQSLSGARVAASAAGARALERGHPTEDDPQYGSGSEPSKRFPAVRGVEVVRDGQSLTVGGVTLVARMTPGHTPGSTTWTWRSCEGARCLDIVYADSLNPVSDDGYRFTGDATHASRIPTFQRSIETVAGLPCDVLISVHPSFPGLAERARGGGSDPLVNRDACRSYAAAAAERLAARIAEEDRRAR